MASRLTFGIDPGLTGAVATLIDGEPGPVLDMPTVEVDGWGEVDARAVVVFIREQRAAHPGAYVSACIEKVGARPGDGGTSAFRFPSAQKVLSRKKDNGRADALLIALWHENTQLGSYVAGGNQEQAA